MPSPEEKRAYEKAQQAKLKEGLPPFDVGAEAGCLACILQADDFSSRDWLSELSLDHFYDVRHQEIYRALKCLNGSSINIVSLAQWLTDKNRLKEAGGFDYVQKLPEQSPSSTLWPSFYEPLENCRVRRSLLRDTAELSLAARNRAVDIPVLEDAARKLAASYSELSKRTIITMQSLETVVNMDLDDSDRLLGDRLLARGQSLVIVGAGALGKSRLALQLSACLSVARAFLGFECRGAPLKIMVLQAENSNRRLKSDLKAIKDWLTPEEWTLFNQSCVIHTLSSEVDYYLSLDSPENQARIIKTIQTYDPDIIIWDSLYNFAIGDLNKDEDMLATLLTLARISKTGGKDRSNIILHHAVTGKIGASKATGYDRASFARNSKVIHSWTRAQINLAPGSPDDSNILVVSCGKCSNGQEFHPFAIRLDPVSMIYNVADNFNFDDWQDDLKGKSKPGPKCNPDRVAFLCSVPMKKLELYKLIVEDCGCSKAQAYRYIETAEKGTKKSAPTITLGKSGFYSKS